MTVARGNPAAAASVRGAGERLSFGLLVFLALWIPAEVPLFRLSSAPPRAYPLFSAVGDLALLALFAVAVGGRALATGRLRRTALDLPLALFALVAALSTAMAGGGALAAAENIGPLLRGVLVFYAVAQLRPSRRRLRRVLGVVVAVALVEAVLALVQARVGPAAITPFIPSGPALARAVGASTNPRIGAAFGTFAQPTLLGLELMAPLALLLGVLSTRGGAGRPGRLAAALALVVLLAGTFVTLKRSLFLVALGLLLVVPVVAGRYLRAALAVSLVAAIGFAAVFVSMEASTIREAASFRTREARQRDIDPAILFAQLTTPTYWQNSAQTSRLWILAQSARHFAGGGSAIGYGLDAGRAVRLAVARDPSLARLEAYPSYRDVYWAALALYVGPLGVALLLWGLLRLLLRALRAARAAAPAARRVVAVAAASQAVVLLPLMFVERALVLEPFAFAFWLLLGLVAAAELPPVAREHGANAIPSGAQTA